MGSKIPQRSIRLRPDTWRLLSVTMHRLSVLEEERYTLDDVVMRSTRRLARSIKARAQKRGLSVYDLDERAGIVERVKQDEVATTGPPSKVEPRLD